jgi:hypothetical protein
LYKEGHSDHVNKGGPVNERERERERRERERENALLRPKKNPLLRCGRK